ncbi:MAG: CvpA family protein [Taibaiella sp.]|nr:CvpA family protein [Taibaiella sp.]
MVLDIIGILLVVVFFAKGSMKGIIVGVFSFVAIILGIVCALQLSSILATYLLRHGYITSGWAQVLSYVVLFIAVVYLVKLLAKLLQKAFKVVQLGWLDRILGGLMYAFIAAFLWSSALWIGNQMHLITPETIASSKTYKYAKPIAPIMFEYIGRFIPFAKHTFSDLKAYFSSVNHKL